MPFYRTDFKQFEVLPPKPDCFDEMIRLAKKLSNGIPFLRVDLYEVNGKVYFGELTFYPGIGMSRFEPEEWDEKVGQWLNIR